VNRLRFVLQSRGILNSIERGLQVGGRFGPTAGRMRDRLLAYADLVKGFGAAPSLPITARVLARNPDVARALISRGVELCVHGLVHNDLSKLSAEAQAEQIGAACDIFRAHGIPFDGFRSPYLRYNAATLSAVDRAGFTYDSNLPFYWEPTASLGELDAGQADGLERGLRFYDPARRASDRSLPRTIGRLIEIPVSLPDDEIMLDRMGLPPARLGEVWLEMLHEALARGEMVTLQLHPERLSILSEPLRGVLSAALASGRVMLATLTQIATWWRQRNAAEVIVAPAGPGTYRVSAPTPLAADVHLVHDGRNPAAPITLPATLACPRKPVVGLSPDVPQDFITKIREAGYFIEITADRGTAGIHFGPGEDPERRLADRAGVGHPLLRQATWPRPFDAALVVSGDIDCLTLGDFARRFIEG
jgi:hypothetical protein